MCLWHGSSCVILKICPELKLFFYNTDTNVPPLSRPLSPVVSKVLHIYQTNHCFPSKMFYNCSTKFTFLPVCQLAYTLSRLSAFLREVVVEAVC